MRGPCSFRTDASTALSASISAFTSASNGTLVRVATCGSASARVVDGAGRHAYATAIAAITIDDPAPGVAGLRPIDDEPARAPRTPRIGSIVTTPEASLLCLPRRTPKELQ